MSKTASARALNTAISEMEKSYDIPETAPAELRELFELTVTGSVSNKNLTPEQAYQQIRARFLIDMEKMKRTDSPAATAVRKATRLPAL